MGRTLSASPFVTSRKIAAYDEEIQHLYEEMEQQIKSEREQFLLKVSVALLAWPWGCLAL